MNILRLDHLVLTITHFKSLDIPIEASPIDRNGASGPWSRSRFATPTAISSKSRSIARPAASALA